MQSIHTKKNKQHFEFDRICVLFWLCVTFLRPIVRTGFGFLFLHHNHNMFLKIFQHRLRGQKVLDRLEGGLFLLSCQQALHKFSCNMLHTQIFNQNIVMLPKYQFLQLLSALSNVDLNGRHHALFRPFYLRRGMVVQNLGRLQPNFRRL